VGEVKVGGWFRYAVLGTALLLMLLFGAVAAASGHGDLDPSFTNFHGRVLTAVGPNDDDIRAVAFQPHGQIVAAGRSSNGADDDFALTRYRPDGSLDPDFGTGGQVTTAVGPGDDDADALVIQKDGKIVVAGSSFNGTNDDFALARYNPDGSLDPTFDGDGKVTTPIGSGDDQAYALALQEDGKLVVAGYSHGANDDFALARYNPDGSPDLTFDGDGKVTTPIGSGYDRAYAVGIQKDGKLVAAGVTWDGSNDDFALARYNPDGSPDLTFDGDGKVTTPIGSADDAAYALALTKDGKIAVAGSTFNGSDNDVAVVRYNGDGSPDPTFDGDGKVTTAIGSGNDEAFAIIQQDDKLVVAGYSSDGSSDDFALVRYTSTGSPDSKFGGDGKVTTSIGDGDDQADALAADSSGRLVAAGYSFDGSSDDFALVRYKSNGALDTFTSQAGLVVSPLGSGDDAANALVLQTSQNQRKPVVAGSSWNGSDDDFALARFNGDGSLDLSFGTGGSVTTPIGAGDDEAHALAVQRDRKLVVAGSSWNGTDNDFALVRYLPDGSPDPAFDGDGRVTTPFGSGDDVVYAVVVQKDGKLVAAGSSRNGSQDDFALARYNPDGSLDASFGIGGKVTTAIGSGGVARALVVQKDGKLVVAGGASNGANDDFALVRYLPGGSPDLAFDGDGQVMTPIGSGDDYAYSLLVQRNGRLVAAGSSFNGTDDDFALVRYTTRGSPDVSFSGDGKTTTPFGSGDESAYALALQKNGKLIAGGFTWNGSDRDFALARYETNGSLNPAFGLGGAGKVTTSFGSGDDGINAIAIRTNRLVAAGSSFNGSDDDVALAQYVLCAAPRGC
jgi:uncharacterized delta-60 repeat protein